MNRSSRFLLASAALAACAVLSPAPADACAVFVEPGELPPVVGHTMILSLGMDQTTLWDQFSYKGAPESFGWILPTKGTVTVGVSSDALFSAVASATAVEIYEPEQNCPNSCDRAGGGSGGGDGTGNFGPDVTIIAEETVGPYETVQLAADDPTALAAWLEQHNYPVPADVQPFLDAYVNEGFNFLAVKLVPGETTESMKPIRVTFAGAMPTFPLRLLNAGTGDKTDVTLFVVAEDRWVPANAPLVTLSNKDLTWDHAADKSDYEAVRAEKLAATGGLGYLIETDTFVSSYLLDEPLTEFVANDPDKGGYGGDPMKSADDLLQEDLAAFHGTLGDGVRVTRIVGALSKEALKQDLQLEAAPSDLVVPDSYTPSKELNAPDCPPDPCAGDDDGDGDGEGCAVTPARGPSGHLSIFAALGLVGLAGVRAARRRRR
jgi:MYXO-CTERM domain-containing protein